MRIKPLGLFVLMLLLIAQAGIASENRFWFANQSDFGAKRGFYLSFENSSAGDAPCSVSTLKLIWAVGDGTNWHFLSGPPSGGWQFDHTYTVHATAGPHGAQMLLDGQSIAQEDAAVLSTDRSALLAGVIPGWAHGPADYWVVLTHLSLNPSFGYGRSLTFPTLPPSLMLFEPQSSQRLETWSLPTGQTLTVEAQFHLSRPPTDLKPLAPLVDKYGQPRAAAWPNKIHTDLDLQRQKADEARRLAAWKIPATDYDTYGGWRKAGWHAPPSTAFRTIRHNGVWWLITPDGNPCFYTSICTAPALEWERTPITGREDLFADLPPHDGPFAAAWGGDSWGQNPGVQSLAFCTLNLIRKYGTNWQTQFQNQTVRRLYAWGFTGLGKWCDMMPGVPSLPVLNRGGVPTLPGGHPDPFDPTVQTKLHDVLASQITPSLHDPDVVCWSLGNEHDEIITTAEIRSILTLGTDVPAKHALVDEALKTLYHGDAAKMITAWQVAVPESTAQALYATNVAHVPDADIESLRQFYADRYYGLIYQTVKSLDHTHLYAGFWIVPGWWENEQDWTLIAKHCDLIGYDNYAFDPVDDRLSRLISAAGKPVICGEFSFPPQYRGTRGFGQYEAAWAMDDADAGRLYARYASKAARNPYCVGLAWFQYRDEPLTGRGPGEGPNPAYGEHFAFGLVDIADTPKWAMLTPMRHTNLALDRLRAGGK